MMAACGGPPETEMLAAYLHRQLPQAIHRQLRDHLDVCDTCWQAWNRHRWDAALSHPLTHDLREYLGPAFQPYLDSSRLLRDQWNDTSPRTDADRRRFFGNSSAYLYNLVVWHASGNRPDYLHAAQPHLAGAKRILDLGSGIGQDTLDLRARGYTVLPSDLPSPSTRFMQWRLRRAGQDHQLIDPEHLAAIPPVDTLWIIDTLDHIPDPVPQLRSVLGQVDRLICENIHNPRSGGQGFHLRRPASQLRDIFRRHGLHEQPEPASPPITVFARR